MVVDTPTMADLAGLLVESKPMFEQMGFEEYGNGWEFDKMLDWWIEVITSPAYDCVIVKDGERIVGVSVVAYKANHHWHTGGLKACEMAHHAAPDLPKVTVCRIMITMLDAIVEKVKTRGAEYFYIGFDPKPQFASWGRYLEKKGYIDSSHVMVAKVGNL